MVEMNSEEIEQLLSDGRIGRLCMAGADGRPYSIPFPFCWTDGALYLRIALTGRKGEVLRENPQVCFEVDSFTDSLDDYASVLIEGKLLPVTDLDEKARVQERNDEKYTRLRGGWRPGHGRSTPLAELQMRKIVVTSLTGRKKETPVLAAS